MRLGIYLGYLITAAMVAVALGGLGRWSRLDRGGRWLVAALVTSAAFVPLSLVVMYSGRSNRLVNEVSLLAETTLILVAFGRWQPTARRRRVLAWTTAGFLVAWTTAQVVQGVDSPFMFASVPVAGLVKVAAAGYTLIGLIQSTDARWTDALWFWAALGVMVIYGTEVILDPFWLQSFGVRNDLALAAFAVNVVGNLVGYGLIGRGLWRLGRVRSAA